MIETTIAAIIDETRVVLAAGAEQGVRGGMEFVIYGLGPEILDPETKESLGRLEIVKGKVRVYYVQGKQSQARTQSYVVRRASWPEPDNETVHERLPVESRTTEYDKLLTVRVGDRARSVETREEE